MNYMPTKSRKWLASGIATAVIASALSLFTVAPASANSVTSVTVSKPLRATTSNGITIATGRDFGTSADDTTALIFQMDDSFSKAFSDAGNTAADDTAVWIRLTERPLIAGTTTYGAVKLWNISSEADRGNGVASTTLALNTWHVLHDESIMPADGSDDTVTGDETRFAVPFSVDTDGAYTFEYVINFSKTATPIVGSTPVGINSFDPSGSFTVTAYGAPTATVTAAVTRSGNQDDTITVTLTGGALAVGESFWMTDDSTFDNAFRVKAARANNYGTVGGADEASDDTVVVDDTRDWRKASDSTMTLTVVLDDTGVVTPRAGVHTDLAGTIKIWRNSGFVLPATKASAATTTLTASELVNAVQSLDITAPSSNILEDDTMGSGLYEGTWLKSATTSGSTTLSGTFQLTNVADYGKSVQVGLYSGAASSITASSTAISSSAIASSSSTGAGTWTFTIANQYLDAADETVSVLVGNPGATVASAGASPKAYQLVAKAATVTPVWTVNGITWKASEDFPGTLIVAPGATISASVKTVDQFGVAITGQSVVLYTTTTDRNASKRVQSALSTATGTASASLIDAGTGISTTTATTRDAIKLTVVDGLEDDSVGSVETVNVAYYSANTLTAPTTNGVAAAAYDGEPVVPGDGSTDAYSSNDRDGAAYDDSLMKFDVTSSVLGASVVFTGTSGVRFYSADTVAPIAGSNIGGTNTATVALKGTNKVVVDSNSTTGVATVYWYCITAGTCTVTATAGAATASASATYSSNAAFARNVVDVKVNDVVGTTGTSTADKKVKVSFKVTDIFGNAVKTFGDTPTVDVMVSGVGSIDGLGSQGTLKTGTDGTAQFYAASSAAGSMQITLDGTGGQFAGVASTTLGTSAAADKKTVTITWSAAPAPEVVYAAPTLTVTKSGNKIILDGTAVEGEGDIIVYIKRVGTTKWVEQAATIEVAAPGDYNGMRIAPKSNVLIRVKQEGTGKFSNQVVVLK
jgi:hypothetical protein